MPKATKVESKCKRCGYCEHCGRGGYQVYPHPYPTYPYPNYPYWGPYYWSNQQVTQSGTSISSGTLNTSNQISCSTAS